MDLAPSAEVRPLGRISRVRLTSRGPNADSGTTRSASRGRRGLQVRIGRPTPPALTSLPRIPAMKRSPVITASRRPRSRATFSDSTPTAGGGWRGRRPAPPPRTVAPGFDRPGGPPGASQDSGPSVPPPGSARRPGPEARRGHLRRDACRRPALVVELREVGGQGRVLEQPVVELGVEAAEAHPVCRRPPPGQSASLCE